MPDQNHEWNRADTIKAVSYLARTRVIDRMVALDDFDVETGRVPARTFADPRDGRDHRAPFPRQARHAHEGSRGRHRTFRTSSTCSITTRCARFMESDSRALGAQAALDGGRDRDQEDPSVPRNCGPPSSRWAICSPHYLLEQFVPGDIFHVDCIVAEKQVVFAIASRLRAPADGSVPRRRHFHHRILERESDDAMGLVAENRRVMAALGMVRGVSHTEFIKATIRRPNLFSGDFGACGRGSHRGTGGSGDGLESVGRMGEGGGCRSGGGISRPPSLRITQAC